MVGVSVMATVDVTSDIDEVIGGVDETVSVVVKLGVIVVDVG